VGKNKQNKKGSEWGKRRENEITDIPRFERPILMMMKKKMRTTVDGDDVDVDAMMRRTRAGLCVAPVVEEEGVEE
jgi:hypothetical protein